MGLHKVFQHAMDFRVVARRPSTGTARIEQLRVLTVQILVFRPAAPRARAFDVV